MNVSRLYLGYELTTRISILAIALAISISSFFYQSTRTDGNAVWSHAFPFWAPLGMVGGLVILVVYFWFWEPGSGSWAAKFAMIGFALIGHRAASYRGDLERSMLDQQLYTEQHLAFGLRVVPGLAVAGVSIALLIILCEWTMLFVYRRRLERYPDSSDSTTEI